MAAESFEGAIKELEVKFDMKLKEHQLGILKALHGGHNVVGVLPTGYGKSEVALLFPLLMDLCFPDEGLHTIVLIVPVNALIFDLMQRLKDRGISGIHLQSRKRMTFAEIEAFKNASVSIVIGCPEAFMSKEWDQLWITQAYQNRCCLMAVDEVHVLVDWGEDFRPVYKHLAKLKNLLHTKVLLTSATLTSDTRKKVLRLMDLKPAHVMDISFLPDRPNIFLDIHMTSLAFEEALEGVLQDLLKEKEKTPKTLIFCRNTDHVGEIRTYLMGRLTDEGCGYTGDIKASSAWVQAYYSEIGSRGPHVQRLVTTEFSKPDSQIRVLVSTNGFGMGVDIPDVARVIHWGVSKCPVWYWQEIGRAGRDGSQSSAKLYATPMSLGQKGVSQDMKETVGSIASGTCVRQAFLKSLTLKDMPSVTPPTVIECSQDHDGECDCPRCRCCSVCAAACPCRTVALPEEHT